MEFNVLPKSKFLSLSPRNNHRSSQTTNQTVNVILPRDGSSATKPKTPVEVEKSESQADAVEAAAQIEPGETVGSARGAGEVHYATRDVKTDEPAEQLNQTDAISTINFLKLVVGAYMNNPLKYNGYVICSVPALENIIETLTGCEECSIDIEDDAAGCCGKLKKIVPIAKIWCRTDETSEVFKYRYSPYLQTFEEYRISLKFVYVD